MVEKLTGKPQNRTYLEQNRIGDHICYYSDLRKMKTHYPKWGITKSLENVLEEIVQAWQRRLPQGAAQAASRTSG
jgi:CDP-paratose 2-epimerase